MLRRLSELHREQLRNVGPDMVSALSAILGELESGEAPRRAARDAAHGLSEAPQ